VRINRLIALLSLAFLAVLGTAAPVFAQTNAEPKGLQNVSIWVNPEYDDALKLGVPSLLVMMEGQIAGVQPPTQIRFLVPTGARMYSAGSKNSAGTYIPPGASLKQAPSSVAGWDEVSFQLTEKTFRVEYYTPVGTDPARAFVYQLARLYPIQGLTVTVQQPKGSDNFTVTPAGAPGVDSEGFNVQKFTYDTLDTVTPVKFQISYIKLDSQPSLSNPPTSPGSTSKPNPGLIIGLGLAAVAVVGGGIYLFTRNGQNSKTASRSARRRAVRSATTGKAPAGRAAVFCSQCGRRIDRAGKFCPGCGADL
jgi:hypothetical protein